MATFRRDGPAAAAGLQTDYDLCPDPQEPSVSSCPCSHTLPAPLLPPGLSREPRWLGAAALPQIAGSVIPAGAEALRTTVRSFSQTEESVIRADHRGGGGGVEGREGGGGRMNVEKEKEEGGWRRLLGESL